MSSPEEHTFQSKNTKFFQIEFSKERAVSSRESSVAGSSCPLGSDLSPVRRSAQLSGFTCGCRERDSGRPIGLIPRGGAHAQRGVVLWFAGEAKDKM